MECTLCQCLLSVSRLIARATGRLCLAKPVSIAKVRETCRRLDVVSIMYKQVVTAKLFSLQYMYTGRRPSRFRLANMNRTLPEALGLVTFYYDYYEYLCNLQDGGSLVVVKKSKQESKKTCNHCDMVHCQAEAATYVLM